MEVEKEKPPEVREAARSRRRRPWTICCGATAAVLIGVVLLIVILAFTVFKPKRPVNTVDAVSLKNLAFSVDALRLRVLINATLNVGLTVKNPNKVGFRYKNSSALLNYRGQLVGEVPIPADKISAGEAKPLNLTLTLLADRLLSSSQAYSDVISGEMPLNTYTKISVPSASFQDPEWDYLEKRVSFVPEDFPCSVGKPLCSIRQSSPGTYVVANYNI